MEKSNYPRGSEWRKWDLHIHSNASDGKASPKEIIEKAKSIGLDVIALTDHHTARNIDEILAEGDKLGISVIPGIEFRTDKGKRSVHIIALFPREFDDIVITTKVLEEYILSPLDLSETKIIKKGKIKLNKASKATDDEEKAFKEGLLEVEADFEEICRLVHDKLGGIIVVHAGDKSNSLDKEISHEGKKGTTLYNSLGTLKERLFEEGFIDVCEISKANDNAEFYLNKFNKPSIVASDAHSIDEVGSNFVWIKADPTFEGLKQILYEAERVFIGDEPPKLKYENNNKEYFINALKIESEDDEGEWFDKIAKEIPLNSGLVSIIGNKGHGKSALADLIGITSNSDTTTLSFLDDDKFLKFSRINKYKASIYYKDGYNNTRLFTDKDHQPTELVKAKYLSQNFVTKICEKIESSLLEKEINAVVFSHLKSEEKYGHTELKYLLKEKTNILDTKLLKERRNLRIINEDIAELEFKKSEDQIKQLQNELEERKRLYEEVKSNPPTEVKEPKAGKETNTLKELEEKKKEIKDKIEELQEKLDSNYDDRKELNDIKDKIEFHEENLKEEIEEQKKKKVVATYKLNLNEMFHIQFNYEPINNTLGTINESINKLHKEQKEKEETLRDVQERHKSIEETLSNEEKKYKKYLTEKDEWENKLKDIKGKKETLGSIDYYENELKYRTGQLEKELTDKKNERLNLVKNIIKLLYERQNVYPEIYKHSQEYADKRADEFGIKEEFIEFDSKLYLTEDFINQFYNIINRGHFGTYYNDSHFEKLRGILKGINLQEENGLEQLCSILENTIKYDWRVEESKRTENKYETVIKQIRNNTLKDFYDFIYSMEYIETKFTITFGGKRIEELSPGERGTLLLIFYLLIDKNKKPIIIDQPEENLDNETIYQKLVPFIKKVKEERQVIIVTHNPNLAIVCDSEQIIYAHIDKKNNNLVSYNSGSIEYHGIRDKAIAILEGTEPAFMNRKNKYHL